MQQTPLSATSATPRPIAVLKEKCHTGLRSIPEILQKYPELQTNAKMGVLGVKLAREALFGDDVFTLKSALWNQFLQY